MSNGGAVSASLLKAAGPELQEELRSKYSHGIKIGEMAISTGKKLQCDNVYHCAFETWNQNDTTKSKQVARNKFY